MAITKKERGILQPEAVECLAILHGLQFCLQLGISNLLVESDCQAIANEIQGQQASLSPLGNIFQDIRELLGRFKTCSIHFAYRESNVVVHLPAKYAWDVTDVVLSMGTPLTLCPNMYGFTKLL